MANTTEQRNAITTAMVAKLEDMFNAEFNNEIYRTGDNLSTITFEAGEVDGQPVYGSVKFTLHKSNYDLDDEIEKYYAKEEEKALKAKLAAERKADKERKIAEQKAKAEQRKQAAELAKQKTQKSIETLKSQLSE